MLNSKTWKTILLALALITGCECLAQSAQDSSTTITVARIGSNAYRVRITPEGASATPDYFYLPASVFPDKPVGRWDYADETGALNFYNDDGMLILSDISHTVNPQDGNWSAEVTFTSPEDEILIGTGQFQDGYLNVKGLTRRLTQVNTQISVPMVISSNGYGILWNNPGLVEYNPCADTITLTPVDTESTTVKVDATGTSGNRQEERRSGEFTAVLDIPEDGTYSLMLDCGQSMSRKHYLDVDGTVLTQADNIWLPPTTSVKTHLTAGEHIVTVKGDKNDTPTLYWRLDDGSTTFYSPVSQGIDYTVFIGTPDEIIAQMRQLTGEVPMMPRWAFGYIHCRERFDTQKELLENAVEFRNRNIPIDLIVQDWQWWGDNGWNAMKFDEKKYPDPKAMTDSLHAMDMRLMLSVWAKVDKNSELGSQFEKAGYYIPDTDWIDFFNPEAAEAYWIAYRDNLLPTGIDAWWQDATEPENDDLHGRTVGAGTINGDVVRNVFPIAVNDRVYRGMCEARPDQRPMIMTRSGAPGIQRYGVMTWSGDVGNDWQTLRRQINGGLGQMATGLPWWTYDAGGFFRPYDQYNNVDYQKRMIRWIQNSVFLPFMRVHGYMSQTEPWRYSSETYERFVESIRLRYSLLPYIYSEASKVTSEGYTLMRPMLMDYYADGTAVGRDTQFHLGEALLVCPVVSEADTMTVYLPETEGGWYDMHTSSAVGRCGAIECQLTEDRIPVFVKAGSIVPWFEDIDHILSSTDLANAEILTLKIYPGKDGEYTLYDDDGISNEYKSGIYSKTSLKWNDKERHLTIGEPQGEYRSPVKRFKVVLPDGTETTIDNKPSTIKL